MDKSIIRNLESKIHQLDRDLGATYIYKSHSSNKIGDFIDLFVLKNEDKSILSTFFTFSFSYRKDVVSNYKLCDEYWINNELLFFDTIILSAIYQRLKENKEQYKSDWIIPEKIIFYSLLFLTLYDNHYEENLNIISAMAKNFEFTSEEMEDYCLAINTFITGKDIFNIKYNTNRAKKFFNKSRG